MIPPVSVSFSFIKGLNFKKTLSMLGYLKI